MPHDNPHTPPTPPTPPVRPHRPGGCLTMIFSFIPGANYMYLGLMKRGLAAMCGFFFLIYLLTLVSGSVIGGPLTVLLALSLPVCYLTFAFDGFNIRRRMMAGEIVPDNIDDVIAFFKRNKRPLFFLFLLFAGLGVATTIIGRILAPFLNLIPLLIIGVLLYIVFKPKT